MKPINTLLPASIITKEVSCGEFGVMKVGPVRFRIQRYQPEAFGNVSYMHGKAPLGLMDIESTIISPKDVDMPLVAIDIMRVLGKKLFLFEMYDTTLKPFAYKPYLEKFTKNLGEGEKEEKLPWYYQFRLCLFKLKMTTANSDLVEKLLSEFLDTFMKEAEKASRLPAEDKETKIAKNNAYSEGLLENGGASTSFFLKYLGKEKTAELFHKVLF